MAVHKSPWDVKNKVDTISLFFLHKFRFSGKNMSRKDKNMSGLTRRSLIAALTAAATAGPAALFAQENVAGKPAPSAAAASISPGSEIELTTTTLASNYSEEHPVVAIAVAKGKKDEDGLTGEKIGQVLSLELERRFHAPSKYFVRESAGNYSNVTFFIKGRLFGPYSLGESVEALPVISMKFDQAHGLPSQRGIDILGKPEPGRD